MTVDNPGYRAGPNSAKSKGSVTANAIIDIRREKDEHSILDDIKQGLRPSKGQEKTLPTLLLYDEAGLKLFEKITYLDEYYLTGAEIEILERYADHIAERIQPGSLVVELGSGNLRKICILLSALERAQKTVEYYALDLSLIELQRTLSEVPKGTFKYVQCFGLHGTYDDGLEWLKSAAVAAKPKSIVTMGSSIGNFTRHDAGEFLKSFAAVLQQGDTLLIGIDACDDPEKVFHAYNDKHDITHRFILNGLDHANRLLGREEFKASQWKVVGEYDKAVKRHHAFVSPTEEVTIDGVRILEGERIRIEESYKYSVLDTSQLFDSAGLVEGAKWANKNGEYALHMAFKPKFQFSVRPAEYAATPVPTLSEWSELWAAWDTVTLQMIPEEELLSKPINLRNVCIFYLGHIPTFLAIHLHRATGEGVGRLEEYQRIFERGIDPDVENPKLCHDHSEIPDEWPPAEEVLAFQSRVRDQVHGLYAKQTALNNAAVRRALWLAFEHEAMHLETLLYMLVQSEKTQPPLGTILPDFEAMAAEAEAKAVANQWINVPETTVTIGINDDEKDPANRDYLGWDNEKPAHKVDVATFAARARPITNGEYAAYLEELGIKTVPASWVVSTPVVTGFKGLKSASSDGEPNATSAEIRANGKQQGLSIRGKSIRTVFGQVPLQFALHWPVMASYNELVGCAKWMGGRIPSLEEVRSIYAYVDNRKSKELENENATKIPAVNSHLINDGVEETPPHNGFLQGFAGTDAGPSPTQLFVNLEGANVGFKHWHPTPVVQNGKTLLGQAEFGGVWEWTSSVLEKHKDFEAMELYPGYTADFFDGKHNIVLGGSWATHPRIAGRKSFVNWYQRNYRYVWAGARLVRDL